MADDLPIYSDTMALRSGMQFADLLRWKSVETAPIWEKSDHFISLMEGASSVGKARAVLAEPNKMELLRAHSILFADQPGAGQLRRSIIAGRFRGQDCPEPEFIDGSLDNFFNWMSAESMSE